MIKQAIDTILKPLRPKRPAPFKFKPFSQKQLKVLKWWLDDDSPFKDKDGIICDGSVRAGKTVVMSLSFVMWSMYSFENENFGMAGKTIGSFRRNVFKPLQKMLKSRGYTVKEHRTENMFTITKNGVTNYYYYFGGKDEGSQDLIQGITLAGLFCDEVALMPRSFVDQATARCSVEGSKWWFNCNPAGPYHWFKTEFLDKMHEKNLFQIHFLMEDNPSLSKRVIDRYKRMYSGVFFKRFILGLWVLAEGVIYDMFNEDDHVISEWPTDIYEYQITADYGTKNPTAFILQGISYNAQGERIYYNLKEYYYDGRQQGIQKTDDQYYNDLVAFAKDAQGQFYTDRLIVDPSAASFITKVEQEGLFAVTPASNSVVDGIRSVASTLTEGRHYVHKSCENLLREFSSYVWDEKAAQRGEDKPAKEYDHALDAVRYGVYTNESQAQPGIRSFWDD